MLNKAIKIVLVLVIFAGAAAAGMYWWKRLDFGNAGGLCDRERAHGGHRDQRVHQLAGRIEEMLVDGDFVEARQRWSECRPMCSWPSRVEAVAQLQQAQNRGHRFRADGDVREADLAASQAPTRSGRTS